MRQTLDKSSPACTRASGASGGTSEACCDLTSVQPPTPLSCPACGQQGLPVGTVTLRALLHPSKFEAVQSPNYRFCASPTCAVVYYAEDGQPSFTTIDLRVPVGLKQREAPHPICYCFGHSLESLAEAWRTEGQIAAVDEVRAAVKAGTCRCDRTHPSGRCCLGDLIKASQNIQAGKDPRPWEASHGA